MAITLRDISKEVGVDVATVSRALRGSYGVHEATRQKIVAVAERLHYRVNRLARGLAVGKSHTLGLVVADIRNPFVTELVRGAEDAAFAAHYNVLLCNCDLHQTREVQYMRWLLERRVDGILMHSVSPLSKLEIKELTASGVPVVLLCQPPTTSTFSGVSVNNFLGGKLAGEYLIRLGHRNIAYLAGPRSHSNFADRVRGFLKAFESPSQTGEPIIIHGLPSFEGGYKMAQRLLAKHREVTAVFAANDVTAFGAARAIFEAGLKIPGDISLMGFDNVEFASLVRPPLTTIHQPKYAMGQAAVEILLAHARNCSIRVPEHRQFGLHIVERQSVGPPPTKRLRPLPRVERNFAQVS